jgi:hypothetical protein
MLMTMMMTLIVKITILLKNTRKLQSNTPCKQCTGKKITSRADCVTNDGVALEEKLVKINSHAVCMPQCTFNW